MYAAGPGLSLRRIFITPASIDVVRMNIRWPGWRQHCAFLSYYFSGMIGIVSAGRRHYFSFNMHD